MKKQISTLAIAVLLIGFTSCNSTSSTTTSDTNNRPQRTEGENKTRQRGERPDTTQLLAEMDANKDGKLSKDEVKGPLLEQFAKIDTNDDDFISKEELENAPKPERRGGQGQRPQRGGN